MQPTQDPRDSARRECWQIVSRFYNSLRERPGWDSALAPSLYEQEGLLLDYTAVHVHYSRLPFAFLPAFPSVQPDVAYDIAVACQLLAEHLVLEDKLLDGQVGGGRIACAIASMASKHRLERALAYFHRHFPPTSSFWTIYCSLYDDYVHAVIDEKNRHEGRISHYSLEEMQRIAKGKAAMGKLMPWSLGVATGEEAVTEVIARSWDDHAISRQLHDDVRDWRADFSDGRNYSFLLTRAMLDARLAAEGQAEVQASQQQVGQAVFLTGWVDKTLALAERYDRQALKRIRPLGCSAWEEWLESHQVAVVRLRQDLARLQKRALHRARLTVPPPPSAAVELPASEAVPHSMRIACRRALAFLLREQALGYPEAAHVLLEWTNPVPGASSCCIWGETFQRALCTNALLLARSNGLCVPPQVIESDVHSLVGARAQDTRGGWRYYGEHTAMCPDADDLGEIVQLTVRAGLPGTIDLCEAPLGVLLDHNSHPDGSLDTWIADPDRSESVQAKAHLHEVWGAQPDVEVMANVLYAMHLYNGERFADAVQRGVDFVEKAQDPAGFWESTWYTGNYYGTWVGARLLREVRPKSAALSKARDYLIQTQRPDRGWGEGGSSPLQTALAVLGLTRTAMHPLDCQIVSTGVGHLLNTQSSLGTWKASDFIRLDRARARGTLPEALIMGRKGLPTYASVTTTTAICLEALVEAAHLLEWRLDEEPADASPGR